MAALAALPIAQKLGESLVDTVTQDLTSLFDPQGANGGQNVPGPANSSASNPTAATSSTSQVGQTLSGPVMQALITAQNDVGALASLAEGQGGVANSELGGDYRQAASLAGQAQQQAIASYQAAGALAHGFASQLSTALSGASTGGVIG